MQTKLRSSFAFRCSLRATLTLGVLAVLLLGLMVEPAIGGTETVRDEFNAISYSGNDGTQNWSNDWQEQNESDGCTSGYLQVISHSYCASGNCMYINAEGITGRALSRQANPYGATSATLTFSYRRYRSGVGKDGSVAVEASGDGGSNWTTLQTYSINGSDGSDVPQSFDISSYIASNTQIRFRTSVRAGGGSSARSDL